jgi:hypothetical protein
MASGKQNKLTGQIGEHLLSAKLGTLGYYASPYSGNVPGFDVIAVDAQSLKTVPIQVKTSNNNTLVHSTINKWIEVSNDEDGYYHFGKLLELPNPDIIWVMIRIQKNELSTARFFICSEAEIQKRIIKRFKAFMERHDYRRPGGGTSPQANLHLQDVEEFEDNWKLLKKSAEPAG